MFANTQKISIKDPITLKNQRLLSKVYSNLKSTKTLRLRPKAYTSWLIRWAKESKIEGPKEINNMTHLGLALW